MTRILVVEDEPGIALGLEDDLRLEGWDVEVAPDGVLGAKRAREQQFDLILLDVMLPGKDGFDVCRSLRRDGRHTPIIMLTAKTQEAEKVMGLELGADDYITKPFSPHEVRGSIKAILRRTSKKETEIFRFGNAEVDFARCEVRRDGHPIELSALEFKLLAVFISNRGRMMTRNRLLDAVWGTDASLNDRVVDNH